MGVANRRRMMQQMGHFREREKKQRKRKRKRTRRKEREKERERESDIYIYIERERERWIGDNSGVSLRGGQTSLRIWKVPGLSQNFPGSSSVTSPELLSLCIFEQSRGSQQVSQTSPQNFTSTSADLTRGVENSLCEA